MSEAGCVCVDGVYSAPEEAKVSALDAGFLFGDGVFETLRSYGGRPFRLEAHLARLALAARALRFNLPACLEAEALQTLARAGLADARVRITLSRGFALHGLEPEVARRPTRVVSALPLGKPSPPGGVSAIFLWRRGEQDRPGPGVKSTSYQRAVLARLELADRRAEEGLYLTQNDEVAEGVSSNLFALIDGRLWTPPVDVCLAGITRQEVLALARAEGLPVLEAPLPMAALQRAEEVFLTSSVAEVVPVVKLEGSKVHRGEVGPWTSLLRERYRQLAHAPPCP